MENQIPDGTELFEKQPENELPPEHDRDAELLDMAAQAKVAGPRDAKKKKKH